jgi:integrase
MVIFRRQIRKEEEMGVFKKGKFYYVDFYVETEKGLQRRRKKVGRSKSLAEKVLADIEVRKVKKEFLGLIEPRKISFSEFATEYLEYSKANKALSSYKRDLLTIEKHLLPIWGNVQVAKISTKMIEDFKLKRIDQVVASTTTRELFTIKGMLRKAVEWGYLKESPAAPVKKLKSAIPHFRYLSKEEINSLAESCKKSDNPQLFAFVLTALNTGMRLGEITALEWKDIDFKRQILRVDNKEDHHTKNYQVRTIPMNGTLINALRKTPRRLDSSYVFTRKSGEKFNKMRTGFENALKRAGLSDVRFHDLRHTFASHLVMGGVDIRTVQELLGHKDIKMTMRYAHLAPDHMKRAVEILDRPAEEDGRVPTKILDGHYLDTEEKKAGSRSERLLTKGAELV